MNSAFLLSHSYYLDDNEENKFIGVYSSRTEAEKAIKRLEIENGFKYHKDGFEIEEYEINKDHWTEGFAAMTTIMVKAKSGEWVPVAAECLPNEVYRINESYENDKLDEYKDGDAVKCRLHDDGLYAVEKVNLGDST